METDTNEYSLLVKVFSKELIRVFIVRKRVKFLQCFTISIFPGVGFVVSLRGWTVEFHFSSGVGVGTPRRPYS